MNRAPYIVVATLNGGAQAQLGADGIGITGRIAAGFNVECESAAATHDVDLLIAGAAAQEGNT